MDKVVRENNIGFMCFINLKSFYSLNYSKLLVVYTLDKIGVVKSNY
jgi:hypothetical protein